MKRVDKCDKLIHVKHNPIHLLINTVYFCILIVAMNNYDFKENVNSYYSKNKLKAWVIDYSLSAHLPHTHYGAKILKHIDYQNGKNMIRSNGKGKLHIIKE